MDFVASHQTSLGGKFLSLLPAIMTALVSASLFFFVPASWAALPVAAAVMLGVMMPLGMWMGLSILMNIFFKNEIENNATTIAVMTITTVVGIAVAVLVALFLPFFAPLLVGIILLAIAIVSVSLVNLFFAFIGICAIASMEKIQFGWLTVGCCFPFCFPLHSLFCYSSFVPRKRPCSPYLPSAAVVLRRFLCLPFIASWGEKKKNNYSRRECIDIRRL
ncbi:MAG: hypothetical protein LBG86_01630 [Puniceicoccales bacterium]|nr:hypothetical protein [Puniceicoccales bacterium]